MNFPGFGAETGKGKRFANSHFQRKVVLPITYALGVLLAFLLCCRDETTSAVRERQFGTDPGTAARFLCGINFQRTSAKVRN